MKKVFLFLTMLLFAFTGTMKAQSLTVHDGTGTSSYVPAYGFYADAYLKCEMVYPAEELSDMAGGMINSITFYASSPAAEAWTGTWQVFVTEVADATISAYVGPGTVVYEGLLDATQSTMTITFDAPYAYAGGNLLVGVYETATGNYKSVTWAGESVTGASVQGYSYSGLDAISATQRNFLPKTTFEYVAGGAAGLATEPDVLELGPRPNGAWMAPYKFNIVNNGGAATVNAMDMTGTYFTYNAEVPASVYPGNPLEVEVTTGDAEPGYISSTLTVLYSGNSKDAAQFDVRAYAYDPAEGDVWENAINVTEFPYSGNAPEMIYKNYELPVATEASDAMYKLAFNEDVLLTAGTTADDGVAVLYPEDFAGEGGPTAENYYEYNGPEVNPGPMSMWFSYDYTGSNTFFGTSAGGGMIFGYRITPAMLQELGLGNCAITTVEAAAREGSYYDLVILKGGDTPDLNNMVYYQAFDAYTPYYFFDVNLDEPQFLGDDENIWVMFYSDSPYAAYCGKQPVDVNNGKLWYTTNLSNWYSNTTYTPEIYTRFLELPTGREVTVNLADMKIRESQPAAGQIAETNGEVKGVAKALRNNKAQNNRGEYDIEGMFVPAGTYYLAMASDEQLFPVEISIDEVPAPEQAVVYAPYDGETWVEYPYLAEWSLPDYTTEMQVLLGTQYPPQTAMIDWTDYLVESAFLPELQNNQSYFMQVNVRNGAGTTYGEIIAFTTPIDGVEGFEVENDELYPGDAAVFSWEGNRTFKGYNLYMYDGNEVTKVNEGLITETTYTVDGLEYNMNGYRFAVTAVYDAGESYSSDAIYVYMTGEGTVSGHVYDKPDEESEAIPVANATVEFRGTDEYGVNQVFALTTNEEGEFEGDILAGNYTAVVATEGYDETQYPETVVVNYNDITEDIDIYTHEFYYPLSMITATEEEDDVLVEWSWTPAEVIVDFEEGVMPEGFTSTSSYPWAITTTNPHAGTYCIKSTCEGVASGTSEIEVTVDVPYDGKMGFWVRVSSEANYDKFHFFIDGVEKGAAISGQQAYAYKEFDVLEGTHTYKWQYAKDSSVNSNDDCAYVDDVTLYRYEEPLPPVVGATTYDFEDSSMMGWTSIDADNDGYGWVSSANPGQYHNSGVSLSGTGNNASEAYVISGSYSNSAGIALSPDNYLVSPAQISAEAGAQIQFWACAQDASYAAEHFGVAVSTTTATAAAFTTIQEWTMTAKNAPAQDKAGRVRGDRQGTWYQFVVDLSAYAGQDIWVAIRHFNCTDMFILNVDDITLATGGSKVAPRGDRSFQSYNLYRRNNITNETPVLVASGLTDLNYTDTDWATLEFGEYQWGVSATYDGYAPEDRAIDANAESVGINTPVNYENNREMWDLVTSFGGTSAGQQAVATDGNYIYTASWQTTPTGGYTFYQYTLDGTFVEGFNITGATGIRDLTTDGEYFYGTSGGANIFCMDFTTRTLVSTINCSGLTSRHISYDPERDGFWSGNWSTLALYSRAGALLQSGPAPTSAYGSAYYKDEDDVEHLFLFCQPNSDCKVYDYNITTNTLGTNVVLDYTNLTPGCTGIAGGCFIGEYNDMLCWFGNAQQDPNLIAIYELESVSPTPPTPPTPPAPTGEGESEIIWSNMIEKDMTATITVTVTLNNGQSPEGTTVTVEGNGDSQTLTYAAEPVVFDVRKGSDYVVTAAKAGYAGVEETITGLSEDVTLPFELEEIVAPVEDLYVSPTGYAIWGSASQVGPVNPNPNPNPNPPTGALFEDDFEDGALGNWTTLDADGDGDTWQNATPATYGIGDAHSGTNCASSWSWNSYSMDPDNWMISPMVDGATNITYYVATNTGYPDHYGVYASSTGTNASDFTKVFEETAGTKGVAGVKASTTNGGSRDMSTWAEKNVTLPAGTKYVAFRHWDSYDMNYLFIDDVTISAGTKGDRAALSYKVMLDGQYLGETTNMYYEFDVTGMEEGSEHVAEVAPLYVSGMGSWSSYTWTYTACSHFAGTTAFDATVDGRDVTVTWTLPGGSNPNPNPNPPTGGWTVDFESGMPTGWATIDADGDGSNWTLASTAMGTGYGHNGSSDMILSKSYDNSIGALNPNNYLVTPQVTPVAGSTFSFYACAQDNAWAAEHFGVAISTGSQTNASDFTMLQEWTMTAKEAKAPRGMNTQGNWYEYSVDLSSYAGQNVYLAIRHFNCSDYFYLDVDDVTFTTSAKGNDRDMWDYVYSFNGTSAGQQAVATDGEFIYTASWQSTPTGGHTFYKYDLQGNFIEGFEIAGATAIRDLTTDGEYFYGTSGASQLFIMDFTNKTLVGTINCSGLTSRHVSYDPVRDGFWSGNWSTLALYSRTGALIQSATAPSSAYGSAYYMDQDGVEHLYLFCQPSSDAKVYDYNIATNTISSSPVFDFASTPGFNAAIAGGCFIGEYNGQVCWFGNAQQDPNLIGIYELEEAGPTPPPTPTDILGALLYRDGELINFFDANTTSYVDENMNSGDYTYTIRVVHGGELNVSYYAIACPETETVTVPPLMVDELEVINSIYPNPTSGDLNINAEAMTHVTVFNAMGQMVYDQDVNTDSMVLNMGQYEAGVYMVRIDTENGSSVKRITVVK